MGTTGYLTLKGMDDYLERLVKAGQDVDEAAARALEAGADVILPEMEELVPKDTHNLEKHLERTEAKTRGNYTYVLVGIRQGTDGDTVRYGLAQEYGWSDKDGHPYIRPAIDGKRAAARRAMVASLKGDGVL